MATVDPTPARPAPPPAVQRDGTRLGERLLERGLIDATQLQYALQKNEVEKQRLGRVLIRHGLANESDIVRVLAEMNGIEYVQVDTLAHADPQVLAMFNRELCQLRQFLPLRRAG